MRLFLLSFCFCVLANLSSNVFATEDAIEFWNKQRKGANFFNQVPTADRLKSARDIGIQFIRLAPNKWNSEARDFLIGNADDFQRIVEEDFHQLKTFLDCADSLGLKVVLTTLNLPGARWRQQNDGKDDSRLWRDYKYHNQAAEFWRELASRLKDHPAIVGYNILNEPHPERATGLNDFWTQDFVEWYKKVNNTEADPNQFNNLVVDAIREVDKKTPIIIDAGLFASPWAFKYLKPIDDDKIIYSFHMYEPYEYTNKRVNSGRYSYPGEVAVGSKQKAIDWNREELKKFFEPVISWCKLNQIPPNRILAGEFGCNRMVNGVAGYLGDLIDIFNEQKWHWAFYSFREDTWTGMDYELGTGPLGWKYWQEVEAGKNPTPPRKDNPLFDVIKIELQKGDK